MRWLTALWCKGGWSGCSPVGLMADVLCQIESGYTVGQGLIDAVGVTVGGRGAFAQVEYPGQAGVSVAVEDDFYQRPQFLRWWLTPPLLPRC